jgi:type IV pilus assembly protein PilB
MEAAGLPDADVDLGSTTGRLQLGGLLVRDGLLTPQQLEEAMAEKEVGGGRLGEIVVRRGWVQGSDVAQALAEQHGLPFLDLAKLEIDSTASHLLTESYARRYRALPVKFLEDDAVLVTVADPTDVVTSHSIRLALGMNIRLAVVDHDALEEAIARVYREGVQVEGGEVLQLIPEAALEQLGDSPAAAAPAMRLINSVIAQAVKEGASGIHFEPQAETIVVRARVDGVMSRLLEIPKSMQGAITNRLKVMAELDTTETRAPQEGRISIRYDGKPMDLPLAVVPTTHGEQLVLRILQRSSRTRGLAELGMSLDTEEAFERAIRQPYGAVIAVGPTGSGKTTTLYAALDLLNEEGRVLTTIEDPVEYQIPGVNQIEVNPKAGLTFARGLRTILRSDPDVLLVGEVRDEETARIAIQAAMTGHVVLTTLHTHNAASSIARLKDMGVDQGLLATAINCIVAQRLARRLCLDCREPYSASAADLEDLGLENVQSPVSLSRPGGCDACAGTGYFGRVALYEVMPVQGELRKLIEASTEEIFAAAVRHGMTTLKQDGVRLCLAGISSLEEIRRVTGDRLA